MNQRDAWERTVLEFAESLGVSLPADAPARLIAHWRRVEEAGASMNLTAVGGDDALAKHILDSLTALTVYDGSGDAADLGAGAGYPGLVLASCHPASRWVLIEATGKKARFLLETARALGLERVQVDGRRAEDVARDARRVDWVTARAVAPLSATLELSLPLLVLGGRLIAMRGPGGEGEAAEASRAMTQLGGALDEVRRFGLPGDRGERTLVVVRKTEPTPVKYPRRGGSLGRF